MVEPGLLGGALTLVPIVPVIWILSFIVRAILKQRDKRLEQETGHRPAPAQGGGFMARPVRWSALLYVSLLLFPAALLAALWTGGFYGTEAAVTAFVLTFAGLFQLPHWLAWRVLGPRGWTRSAKAALWLACFAEPDDRRGALELLDAVYRPAGSPKWEPGAGKVTLWTLFALALQAERRKDQARADLIVEGIQRLGRIPHGTLRRKGVELLAWPAIDRREWRKALGRLEPGRGRGVRLLRLLILAHRPLGKTPSALALRLAWLLAPERRRTRPYLEKALAARRRSDPAVPPRAEEPLEEGGSVWLRHLRLLSRAAYGRTVRTADLEALAASWQETLEGEGYARVLSRGMELGVQGVAPAAEALRHSVAGELELLARVAEGPWRAREGDGLAGWLRSRQIEGILRVLERETEGFPATGELARELDPPLVELDRWYRFRLDFERLRAAGGVDALRTAWFNGLRYVACNWPVDLGKAYPGEAGAACREMHLWSASLASELGDEQISRLSGSNAMSVK
jgi:hypothetical protein